AVAAVERADLGPDLPEPGVVRRDRQVADQVQHVAAADGPPGDHRHDRLRAPAHRDMQIGHVEAPGRVLVQLVAAVTANPLVTTGAARPRAGAGEGDDPDRLVLPGEHEGPVDLDQGVRTEGVVHLGTVDGDLGDSVVGGLVADVLPLAVRAPRGLLGHAPIIVCSGFAAAGPPADGVAGRAAAAWIHRTRRPPWAWKGRGRASLPGAGHPAA